MISANLKELYSGANGDVWFLEHVPDGLFVIHQPFLRDDLKTDGPEQKTSGAKL
jgi:hypothetical protein